MAVTEPVDQSKNLNAVVRGAVTSFPPQNRAALAASVTTNGVITQAVNATAVEVNTSEVNGMVAKTNVPNATAVKAVLPASSVYVFTSSFSYMKGQQLLTYRNQQAYSLSPADVTSLTAQSAPMVLQ